MLSSFLSYSNAIISRPVARDIGLPKGVSVLLLWLTSFGGILHHATLLANHAMAVDLTYTCLDANTYELTLWFYFDCGSTVIETPPVNPLIQISSASCGYQFNRNLAIVNNMSGDEVSQLCQEALEAGESNCQGGTLPGVERYVYKGTVLLPDHCSDWVFAYRLGGGGTRSADITNLQNPDFYKIYVEAQLNNLDFECNSSPTFASIPVAYFCTQNNTFFQTSIEPDGDSLVYSLAEPLDNVGTPVPHAFGTTALNPIYDNTFFVFDGENGNINFGTSTAQRAVVAVLVSEYRNGQWVGSTRRDMQWVILDCSNEQPEIVLPDGNAFEVCVGEVLSFRVKGVLSNGGVTTFLGDNMEDFAGATWLVAGQNADTTTAVFTWQPSQAQAGDYVFGLTASDETCPIPAYTPLALPIRVVGKPDAGPDIFYCDTATTLTLTVAHGSNFVWQPMTGVTLLADNGSQVGIDPDVLNNGGTYFTVSNNCGLSDTVLVAAGVGFSVDVVAQMDICRGDSAILSANILPTNGNYSYAWWPATSLSAANAPTVWASPDETTLYSVSVTDNDSGCRIVRTITAAVADNISASLTATDDTICNGQTVQLNASALVVQSLPCGLAAAECNNTAAPDTVQVGTGIAETTDITPYNAFWENSHLQLLYRADELTTAGLSSATIMGIGFRVTDKYSSVPFETFTLKMGCTNVQSLSNFAGGALEVFDAPTNGLNTTEGWNWHLFDTPYSWDGASNLLVELCQHIDNANVFDRVAYTATTFNSVCSAFTSSGSNGCTLSNTTLSTLRPDIRFIVCRPEAIVPTLEWIPTTGLDNPSSFSPIAAPQQTTTYTAHFAYNGCVQELSHTIVIPSSSFAPDLAADELGCAPMNTGGTSTGTAFELHWGASDLPPTATVAWLPSAGLDNPTSATPTAVVPSDSTVTYTALLSLNDFCATSFNDTITLVGEPAVWVSVSPDVSINVGEAVSLSAFGSFAHISWSPTAGLSATEVGTVTATPSETTVYTATVSDSNGLAGCTASASVQVTVNDAPVPTEVPCLVIPTAFSPNGDGLNDVFRPVLRSTGPTTGSGEEGLSVQLMEVYNRYGQRVFGYTATTGNVGIVPEWDGRYKGQYVELGSYVYVLKAICEGEVVWYRGGVGVVY